MCDFHENLGETYVLSDGNTAFFSSRRLGGEFEHNIYRWAEVDALDLDVDRPFAYLVVKIGDLESRLKFGNNDVDELKTLISNWRLARAGEDLHVDDSSEPLPPEEAEKYEMTPFLAGCAALMAMMEVDGDLNPVEKAHILGFADSRQAYDDGRLALRKVGVDVLFKRLGTMLNDKQAVCLLANLMEVGMADGKLMGVERILLERIRETVKIDEDTFETIYSALMIKNNLSVFSE